MNQSCLITFCFTYCTDSFKEDETRSYSVWERHSKHEYANFVKILFVLDCRSFEDGVEEIDEHDIYDIQQAQAVKDEASVNMDTQVLSRKHITRRKAAKETGEKLIVGVCI